MRVLVIDAEPGIADRLELSLRSRWLQARVLTAETGAAGLDLVQREEFDLVVLEASLPDGDGLRICQAIRDHSDVPIVFLTTRCDHFDRVWGLEVGADDYLTKPWEHSELLARIRAVLRRCRPGSQESAADVTLGRLEANFTRCEVRVDGRLVRLTATEYRLLHYLLQNAGHVLPHRVLIARVWGEEHAHKTAYLKVHIQRLRRKLGDDPRSPQMIATERGVGYRFIRPTGTR